MPNQFVRFFVLLTALWLAGCGGPAGDPKEKEVLRTASFVKSLINSTATNQMAALSLASMAELGGTITTFIAASLPDNEKFSCFTADPRPQPYCVTIQPGDSPGEYLINGYGQSVDQPLISERAVASAPKRR